MLNSDFMELKSQRLTLEEIIEALKQDQINLIEIFGMRGIGKTTMLKEVVKRVKEENLFDEVCLLDVSGEVNPGMIRQRVVDKFYEADLRKDRKILVVLDNIGVEFDVRQLKTPWACTHKSFKILYTSRIQGIWRDVPHKKEIALGLLSDDDAWKLFTFKANVFIDTPRLLPLAKEIVNVCGCLPLLLVTIRGMVWEERYWPYTEDSLEVMKCKLEDMLESLTSRIANPFPSMTLLHVETASSNYKEMDEKARALFLFCCLFEREKSIRVEDLARCAWALRLFLELHHLDKVREQVKTSVNYLKEKYFLRDGEDDEHVAVPALVRTIGIFVASSRQGRLRRHGAVFECRDAYVDSHISVISGAITELPAGLITDKRIKFLLLECSKLKSLDFHLNSELKVLFLKDFNGTLMLPRNLQMLSLEDCPGDACKNISGRRNLYRLKILSFRRSGIKELPKEIGNLKSLRLLDLRETYALYRIPPKVISRLVFLEELYLMDSNFVDWEEVGDEEGRNANLNEFEDLHKFNTSQFYDWEEVSEEEVSEDEVNEEEVSAEEEGVGDEEGRNANSFRNANLNEFANLRKLKTLQIYVRTDVAIPEVLSRFEICRVVPY